MRFALAHYLYVVDAYHACNIRSAGNYGIPPYIAKSVVDPE
jgi:hypothetical protein